jgi:hypothetical protein
MYMTYEKCIEVHWRMFCPSNSNLSLHGYLTLREMSYHLHVKDVMQKCVEVHYKRFGTSTQHQWLMGLSLSLYDLQEIS